MSIMVMILICASSVAKPDCQPSTALDVIRGPDARNELMCGFHGQAYLAQSAIGRDLRDGEWVKIMCRRSTVGGNVG